MTALDGGPGPGLADPAFHPDPYGAFAALRAAGPVRGRYYDGSPIWLVARYEDARTVLQHASFANRAPPEKAIDVGAAFGIPRELRPFFERHVLAADPPDHARLRRLIGPAFLTGRARDLRPWVRSVADRLLDDLAVAGANGREVDVVGAFALPLPVHVVCEVLGVDTTDRTRWREWVATFDQSQRLPGVGAASGGLAEGASAMVDFAGRLLWARRSTPGPDLTSALVRAHDEAPERLDEVELVAMVMGLLGAGYRTTSRLIANGVHSLLTHPDQLDALRVHPGLLPRAVEEMLRYRTSLEIAPALRYAVADVEVGGATICRGDAVQVVLAGANRDSGRFADADRFDVERVDNAHLAFGHGAHFCPGAALARMEIEVAVGALLRRFPGLRLAVAPEAVPWHRSFSRGPLRLPVRLR